MAYRPVVFMYYLFFLLAAIPCARAGEAADGYRDLLHRLNEVPPAKNRDLNPQSEFIGRSVRDDSGRAIGRVEDILVDRNGRRQRVVALVDGAGPSRQSVFLDLRAMDTLVAGGDLLLPYHRDDLRDMQASQLDGIEPAVGETADVYGVVSLAGASLYAEDERALGRVDSVLFSDDGNEALALAVSGVPGGARDRVLAVPFGPSFWITGSGAQTKIYLRREYAAILLEEAPGFR